MAAVLLAAVLTGCLGFGGEDRSDQAEANSRGDPVGTDANETNETVNETPEDVAEVPQPEVHWFNGTVQGGSAGVTVFCLAPMCENVFEFPVENGTTGIVVELTWETDDALNLYVYPPFEYCESSDPIGVTGECPESSEDTDGEAPPRVEIRDDRLELDGDWQIRVFPQDSYTEGTEFTLAASVFDDAEPPQGFTKIPEEA